MTSPAFLVDECLPYQVTQALRNRNLDATDVVTVHGGNHFLEKVFSPGPPSTKTFNELW